MKNSLSDQMLDDATSERLIQIARNHVKFALEHSQPQTTKQRREAIRNEISALRIERDVILAPFQRSTHPNDNPFKR